MRDDDDDKGGCGSGMVVCILGGSGVGAESLKRIMTDLDLGMEVVVYDTESDSESSDIMGGMVSDMTISFGEQHDDILHQTVLIHEPNRNYDCYKKPPLDLRQFGPKGFARNKHPYGRGKHSITNVSRYNKGRR